MFEIIDFQMVRGDTNHGGGPHRVFMKKDIINFENLNNIKNYGFDGLH
jgi:hypothetical protein